ncbi:MAG: endonuclease MutS2 [Microscillaceae bacterium]|nr:endonuclease MutS2 [Microscillaceae bacterium]
MIYPQNLEEKLGFDRVRELLKENCLSSLGQSRVEEMVFSLDYEEIACHTAQTDEFVRILQTHYEEAFPSQHYLDVSLSLTKAAIEGAFLSEAEFYDLKLSLGTIRACLRFFRKAALDEYPELQKLAQEVVFDDRLVEHIELVIDERGQMRDNASFELRRLRAEMIQEQSRLRKRLEQILKQAKSQGFSPDDANPTIREGRLVLPVLAESKRQIKGVVHDESATGQTVYLEPAEIIDLNNYIRELQYQERREMLRILTELTSKIRPEVANLRLAYAYLAKIDFIRAKARFAQQTQSVRPVFINRTLMDWREARHPLLWLGFQAQGKKVVPLSLQLDHQQRILLISGPNAGGKSVSLKTVGLLQYMFQCGLLVPMHEKSSIGLFKDIFADIGDEQSLENDLSTYSSHLNNMKFFLKLADKTTLFLIDEFGTGTEPSVGGAMAEAILEELVAKKAFGVITTHYRNLKIFAQNHEGLTNGAMLFDAENLEPLYQLELGKPGSSFAFEIAHKIGLPLNIVQKAKEYAGDQQVNYDLLLRELEMEKRRYESQASLIKAKEERLNQVTAEYQKLKDFLDQEKKSILNQAKGEAENLLREANQRIEHTIREIKESQAQKESTQKARQELETYKQKIKPEPIPISVVAEPVEVITLLDTPIEAGDQVRIKGQNALGEVLQLKGKDAEILIGDLKSTIKLDRLEKIKPSENKNAKKPKSAIKGLDLNEKMAHFSPNLDLRGKRGEEALPLLMDFMDDALLLGQQELRIIHGKGDGILRKLVREQLRKYKEVASLTNEHEDRGGAGITIVTLQ